MNTPLNKLMALCQTRLEKLFHDYLVTSTAKAPQLLEAMAYAVQNGGKRLRPLIIYAIGQSFSIPFENLDAPACAIEFIHAYSLIHDDLPAMDNADLRRGKPACHKAFPEATAILAGDALQTLAFEVLATHASPLTIEQRLQMITVLAQAAGEKGMAGGQQLDLEGVHSLDSLNQMYQLKTGALFSACIQLACIAGDINDPSILNALKKYIENISLAFQIQDDLFDIQGNTHVTGKPSGIDLANKKITYPNRIGIEKTEHLVNELFQTAIQSIATLGVNTSLLSEIAYLIMKRVK